MNQRLLVAAVTIGLSSFATSASSQTGGDCMYPSFPLRSFPLKLVSATMGDIARDPNNTIVGSVVGRCDGGEHRVFVCGVFARTNRAGYIDRARPFFGVYQTSPIGFKVHALDRAATQQCNQKFGR